MANCCELLSFFSIFGIQNNWIEVFNFWNMVVNCFHFSVSLGYKTTNRTGVERRCSLWIAFIFQYLWDTKQQNQNFQTGKVCCELLSFFSIFGIQNNNFPIQMLITAVVNCFHFSVSLGYKTTNKRSGKIDRMLWIAFIFQYLWDTKQQFKKDKDEIRRCELLSFFSIFGIQNNAEI